MSVRHTTPFGRACTNTNDLVCDAIPASNSQICYEQLFEWRITLDSSACERLTIGIRNIGDALEVLPWSSRVDVDLEERLDAFQQPRLDLFRRAVNDV